MKPFIVLSFAVAFALLLPLHAVPVTQTSSTGALIYDAVVVGTNGFVELMPESTGLPSPISTLTNADISTCASGDVCIEEAFTYSAGHVASSVVAEFHVLPTSIITALNNIVGGTEAGVETGRTFSNTVIGGLSVSLTSTPTGQSGITGSVSASETFSGLSAVSVGTSPTQNPSSNVVSSPHSSATTSVNTLGSGASISAYHTAEISNLTAGTYDPTVNVAGSLSVTSQVLGVGNLTRSRTTGPITYAPQVGTSPTQSSSSGVVSSSNLSAIISVNTLRTETFTLASNISEIRNSTARTYSIAINVAESSSITSQTLEARNRTRSGTSTTPLPASSVTYALQATSTQDSLPNKTTEVGNTSDVASTNASMAYVDSVTATETALPIGVSIQTITTSTCTTAGAVITTTSSGSTVATEVPELCTHGLAFLIFGLPGFHSSSDLPSLCHKSFSFPFGIIWRLLCPPGGRPTISITSVDPTKLPPGGGPPGDNPNGGDPDDQNPTATPKPTATEKPTTSQKQSQTTQSSVSSSAAATPTRYLVMPLIDTTQSAMDELFEPYAQRDKVTQAKRSDGSLEFFAIDLDDAEASTIDANSEFIIIQESGIDVIMPDSGPTDPDLNSTSNVTEAFISSPQVSSRNIHIHGADPESKGGGLLKRIPVQGWAEKFAAWSLAIISLVPGLPLPDYRLGDGGEAYPYYFVDAGEPRQYVRVYLVDTGLNMQHPDFNGRLKPGITRGRTQDDWDIDWLFPRVDYNERSFVMGPRGMPVQQPYEYSYIDPDSPNPNGGIHPAYSDTRLRQVGYGRLTPHGTRLSGFIIGDRFGQAQNCRFTVVKVPQYTNGQLNARGALFPLYSVKDALNMMKTDIEERKAQGERYFVISSPLGYPFGEQYGSSRNSRAERRFSRLWTDFLGWLHDNAITIVASAGNDGGHDPDIDLIPARLFRNPNIVIGSVTPNAMAHPGSQGRIGDGILTAYAPGPGALVVSSNPSGAYIYEYVDPYRSGAVSSYGT